MTPNENVGRASGFSVEEDPEGGFRWSAFGPRGARHGRAATRREAREAAVAAERELAEDLPQPPPTSSPSG